MRSRHKLEVVRQVYADQEAQLTRELSRLRRERDQHREQADELYRLLEEYRQRHRARTSISAAEAMRFRKFYERMTDAVGAQEAFVNRLGVAVEDTQRQWQESYRQRRGLDLVLERYESERSLLQRRRDRRAGAPRSAGPQAAGGDGWTMLNDSRQARTSQNEE